MRVVINLYRDSDGGVRGDVRSDDDPASSTFVGWLHLFGLLERVAPDPPPSSATADT